MDLLNISQKIDKGQEMKIDKNQHHDNSMATLRSALFNSIMDVRNGQMKSEDANSIAKLGHQIIESYKTEIKAVEVANGLKDNNLGYAKAMNALEQNKEAINDSSQ